MDTPYGYWYEALDVVAHTLRPDDPAAMVATKAIRKAVLLPNEAVTHYIVQLDDDSDALMLTALTDRTRLVRMRFEGETVEHLAVPVSRVQFLGGAFSGTSNGTTEVWGFNPIVYHFVLEVLPEPLALSLPTAPPNSVGGMEEIAFAQALLAAISS